MEENQEKVAPSRLKKGRVNKRVVIPVAVAAVVVVLGIAYLILCGVSHQGDTLYEGTTIGGVEVGGLTAQEATTLATQTLAQQMASAEATFLCDGATYVVSGDLFTLSVDDAVAQAVADQKGSFITAGYRALVGLAGGSEYDCTAAIEDVSDIVREASQTASYSTWQVEGDYLLIQKGVTGHGIDQDALRLLLADQMTQVMAGESPDPVEAPITLVTPLDPDFDQIQEDIYQEAASAHLDSETKEFISAIVGVDVDVAWMESQWSDVAEGDTLAVPLIYEVPEYDDETYQSLLFADVLASTQTYCSGTAARLSNNDVVCSFVNGTILLPGEVFSYTDVCGPFTAENGYQYAGAYVAGLSVQAMAGGICQLSSTLYWATLEADLEIVERTKHGYNTGYMPVLGTDATIYEGVLDFQFANDTDFPIMIECWRDSSTSIVYVNIYGTNTTGLHGDVYSVIVETFTPKTFYEANEAQPIGTTSVDPERTAYTGYTVDVYQNILDDDGNVVETNYLYRNTYNYRDKVIFYNPADAEALGIDPATGTLITTTEEPTVEEPTVEEPTVEDPAVEEEPTVEEPTAEEPAVEEPTVEEPAVEEPVEEEVTVEEPEPEDTL